MARYLYEDLRTYPIALGCHTEGDAFEIGMGWYSPINGMPFTVPSPVDGYADADVVDIILADRWIPTAPGKLKRYPDDR